MGIGQMGQWLRVHSDLSKNSAQFLAPMGACSSRFGKLDASALQRHLQLPAHRHIHAQNKK